MRRLIVLMLVGSVLLAGSVFAQGKIYGHTQVGTTMTKGATSGFTTVLAGDVPLSTDTAKNYVIFSRVGYLYEDEKTSNDAQAAYAFVCGTKYLDLGKTTSFGLTLGTGFKKEAQSGGDATVAGFKGELGFTFVKSLTVSIGADYYPVTAGPDQAFVYLGIDLLP